MVEGAGRDCQEVIVRAYVKRDWWNVLRLARMMHEESPIHRDFPFSEDKVMSLVTGASLSEDWLALVAMREDFIVGFALFVAAPMYFSEEIEVSDLAFYVRPEARGGFAAPKMLKYVEMWASTKSAAKINIGVHTGINHAQAVQFFGRMGYPVHGYLVSKSVN